MPPPWNAARVRGPGSALFRLTLWELRIGLADGASALFSVGPDSRMQDCVEQLFSLGDAGRRQRNFQGIERQRSENENEDVIHNSKNFCSFEAGEDFFAVFSGKTIDFSWEL